MTSFYHRQVLKDELTRTLSLTQKIDCPVILKSCSLDAHYTKACHIIVIESYYQLLRLLLPLPRDQYQ